MIDVEVAYATPEAQVILRLSVLPNATIADAINASSLLDKFPGIDLATVKVGVFGQLATLQTRLTDNDRVEVYRPLKIDPKEMRRLKARNK